MVRDYEAAAQRRTLLEVIGREKLPEERATNMEHLSVRGDPTLAAMLAEIDADVAARDALVPEYIKADEKSRAASGKSMGLYQDIKRLDARIAKTREAFEVLKARAQR